MGIREIVKYLQKNGLIIKWKLVVLSWNWCIAVQSSVSLLRTLRRKTSSLIANLAVRPSPSEGRSHDPSCFFWKNLKKVEGSFRVLLWTMSAESCPKKVLVWKSTICSHLHLFVFSLSLLVDLCIIRNMP